MSAQAVSVTLSNLNPATTYHFRVSATNILGRNSGLDQTVTTLSNSASSPTVLIGWDVSALPGGVNNFGPSPLSPTTNGANLTIAGLTRGAGVGTNGSAAGRAWGGNTFTNSSAASAIASNRFATFAVMVNAGFKVSYSSLSKFDYRRSGTGPTFMILPAARSRPPNAG